MLNMITKQLYTDNTVNVKYDNETIVLNQEGELTAITGSGSEKYWIKNSIQKLENVEDSLLNADWDSIITFPVDGITYGKPGAWHVFDVELDPSIIRKDFLTLTFPELSWTGELSVSTENNLFNIPRLYLDEERIEYVQRRIGNKGIGYQVIGSTEPLSVSVSVDKYYPWRDNEEELLAHFDWSMKNATRKVYSPSPTGSIMICEYFFNIDVSSDVIRDPCVSFTFSGDFKWIGTVHASVIQNSIYRIPEIELTQKSVFYKDMSNKQKIGIIIGGESGSEGLDLVSLEEQGLLTISYVAMQGEESEGADKSATPGQSPVGMKWMSIEQGEKSMEQGENNTSTIKSILPVVNDTQIIAPNTMLLTKNTSQDYEVRLDKMEESNDDSFTYLTLDGFVINDYEKPYTGLLFQAILPANKYRTKGYINSIRTLEIYAYENENKNLKFKTTVLTKHGLYWNKDEERETNAPVFIASRDAGSLKDAFNKGLLKIKYCGIQSVLSTEHVIKCKSVDADNMMELYKSNLPNFYVPVSIGQEIFHWNLYEHYLNTSVFDQLIPVKLYFVDFGMHEGSDEFNKLSEGQIFSFKDLCFGYEYEATKKNGKWDFKTGNFSLVREGTAKASVNEITILDPLVCFGPAVACTVENAMRLYAMFHEWAGYFDGIVEDLPDYDDYLETVNTNYETICKDLWKKLWLSDLGSNVKRTITTSGTGNGLSIVVKDSISSAVEHNGMKYYYIY